MNQIYIEHNPFTVETKFLINGAEPAENCQLSSYKESRLQRWVESIFSDLYALLNGETLFEVEFKGVESDYIDLQDAAVQAQAQRQEMNIRLNWTPVRETEDRLNEINALMAEAMDNPQFADFLENDATARKLFKEATEKDFPVYVMATMSSGKSTLINAMLGQDLLPAANEATTATIAKIYDDKSTGGRFFGSRNSAQGELEFCEDITLETLQKWNLESNTKTINLNGNIVAMQPREHVRLVLTDTPGPNNSQNSDHELTTMSFIKDTAKRNPLIIYVLNATQLGTNDDRNLLSLVAEIMENGGKQNKERFIFVVNKIDTFDPEKGENVDATLKRVRHYLKDNGIKNPQIYPVSAYLTRLLRTKNPEKLTRKERNDLANMTELFLEEESMNLPAYMPLTPRVQRSLAERPINEVMKRSGLPIVEVMIDEYIDKYTFPNRLNRAYSALKDAIEKGMREAELQQQLSNDEHTLALVNDEIERLQEHRRKGLDTEAYRERIRREGKGVPLSIAEKFSAQDAKSRKKIHELHKEIDDPNMEDKTPSQAQKILDDASERINFIFNDAIGNFDSTITEGKEYIENELRHEFKEHIESIFDNVGELSLPALKGLSQSIKSININLSLDPSVIQKKNVKTGSHEESDSSWYNPFSWGRKKVVIDYKSVEFVNVRALWNPIMMDINAQTRSLITGAVEQFERDKDKIVDLYLNFLNCEFDKQFDLLIANLKEQQSSKTSIEKAIAMAKAQQQWIEDFKTRLDSVLAI
ncbi:dynamin family protein [Pluralibacter gergoviae]|nr:dynamin family protein [Pluralibacter gergoviae]ELC3016065.1 dynamin family protein [Pluralibacter gergoviae]ELC3021045.1 dynamin family protein [Pluralibacter gergoviae]